VPLRQHPKLPLLLLLLLLLPLVLLWPVLLLPRTLLRMLPLLRMLLPVSGMLLSPLLPRPWLMLLVLH
jgi:hypothetical protein